MISSPRILATAMAAALLGAGAVAQAQTSGSSPAPDDSGGDRAFEAGRAEEAATMDGAAGLPGTAGDVELDAGTDAPALGSADADPAADAAMGEAADSESMQTTETEAFGGEADDQEARDASGTGTADMSGRAAPMGARDAAGSAGAPARGRSPWLPSSLMRPYVGASLGRAEFDQRCVRGFDCDDPDLSGKIFAGGLFNEWLGAELGWIHFGRAKGSGGRTRAHGLNLSAVGTIPLSQAFSVFAKLGATYAWTRTSAAAATGVPTGSENGFAWSAGLGAAMDITPDWSAVLEWERHHLKFAGGRDDVDLVTLGLKYRF